MCIINLLSARKTVMLLLDALQEKGIASAVYYPVPLHQQEVFVNLYNLPVKLPQVKFARGKFFRCRCFRNCIKEEIRLIADVINNAQ